MQSCGLRYVSTAGVRGGESVGDIFINGPPAGLLDVGRDVRLPLVALLLKGSSVAEFALEVDQFESSGIFLDDLVANFVVADLFGSFSASVAVGCVLSSIVTVRVTSPPGPLAVST